MAIAIALFCYGRANQPISAQAGYAAGTKEILECWFKGRQIRDEYLIVYRGKLAGADAHSYRVGDR
jgi:formate dehydrogenase